jgi:predicted nucleotidyltransferase component of viral defense system
MIPAQNIVAWGQSVPWVEQRQIEQDLIISRGVVELFADPFLKKELRFRGGTALNKLHFPKPLRYSEDIDLTRTTAGPIGPVLDRVREILEPWLGHAQFDPSKIAPKLRFRVAAEDGNSQAPIRLKVEIHTRERTAYDDPVSMPYAVKNPWFTGSADIATFSNEEILATKLRALLQRNKGRDLVDLSHAATVFGDLDVPRLISCFGKYLSATGDSVSGRRPRNGCSISSKTQTFSPTFSLCSPRMKPRISMTRPDGPPSATSSRPSSRRFQAKRGRSRPRWRNSTRCPSWRRTASAGGPGGGHDRPARPFPQKPTTSDVSGRP